MADLTGQTLGKYQIVERLGRGGMADVYKGYQPGLERYVAVKVMHAHLAEDADFVTRFKREAKTVAGLRHPNIVQVFDFDAEAEKYYMVMEYIEGGRTLKESLQEMFDRGERLPYKQTLEVIAKLADALQYAHERGMIHRDIKPSNVLVASLDNPVLSDFGIARILDQSKLTSSGAMIGTPAYMSPEAGRGEKADERADIYSLGIMLYEMLTGHPPYDADTPYGIILKHINDPIISPRQIVSNMPAVIEPIVLRCLAKDPADRYQTAAALRDACRAAIDHIADATTPGLPTMPLPMETQMVAPKKPFLKRRWVQIAGGVIGLCLIAFCILTVINGANENKEKEATAQAGDDQTQPTDETPVGEVESMIQRGLKLLGDGDPEQALILFEQALAQSPDHPIALTGQGLALIATGREEEAAASIFRAGELASDNPFVQFGLGFLHTHSANYYDVEAARGEYTAAIESCGDNAVLCAESLAERAQIYAWTDGDYEAAIADQTRAIELEPNPYALPWRYETRASIRYYGAGDVEGAYADEEMAYDVSPDKESYFLEAAAGFAFERGDHERAAGYFQRLFDEKDNDPRFLVGIAFIAFKAGDIEISRQMTEQALAAQPDMLGARYMRALLLLEVGENPGDALADFRFILDNESDSEWQDYWRYSFPFFASRFGHELYFDAARAALETGDPEQALSLLETALEREDWWGPYVMRGQILAAQGDTDGAIEAFEAALERIGDNPELEAEIERQIDELGG